jgi:HK97 family phage prohead protease
MEHPHTGLVFTTAALHGAGQDQDGQRIYTWIASTGKVDDNGNIFDPQGWSLEDYRRNPVVLSGSHNWNSLPVAKAIDVVATPDALVAHITFAGTPAAQEVKALVDGGFLNAISVGALPIEYELRYKEGTRIPIGAHFHSQSLRELSIVTVPANTDAVRIAALEQGDAPAIVIAALQPLKESLWTPQHSKP